MESEWNFTITLYRSSHMWWCSVKKIFLKILQNLQENTCTGVSLLISLETPAHVFSCEFCEILKNIYFVKYLRQWLLLCILSILLCVCKFMQFLYSIRNGFEITATVGDSCFQIQVIIALTMCSKLCCSC